MAFGLFYFKRRDRKAAIAAESVETGSAGGGGEKDKTELKPVAQPDVAEVEASPGTVWNETDGKALHGGGGGGGGGEETKSLNTGTTQAAEVDGAAVIGHAPGAFTSTTHGGFDDEAVHLQQQHLAEVDGGAVPVGSTATTPGQDGFETPLSTPQQQHQQQTLVAEMDARDIIRPDSGTLVPDSPRLGAEGVAVAVGAGGQRTSEETRRGVAEMDASRILRLDEDTFAPFAGGRERTEEGEGQRLVAEVDGGAVEFGSRPFAGLGVVGTDLAAPHVVEVEGAAVQTRAASIPSSTTPTTTSPSHPSSLQQQPPHQADSTALYEAYAGPAASPPRPDSPDTTSSPLIGADAFPLPPVSPKRSARASRVVSGVPVGFEGVGVVEAVERAVEERRVEESAPVVEVGGSAVEAEKKDETDGGMKFLPLA